MRAVVSSPAAPAAPGRGRRWSPRVERGERVPRGGHGLPVPGRGQPPVVDRSLDDHEVGIERRIQRGDALAVRAAVEPGLEVAAAADAVDGGLPARAARRARRRSPSVGREAAEPYVHESPKISTRGCSGSASARGRGDGGSGILRGRDRRRLGASVHGRTRGHGAHRRDRERGHRERPEPTHAAGARRRARGRGRGRGHRPRVSEVSPCTECARRASETGGAEPAGNPRDHGPEAGARRASRTERFPPRTEHPMRRARILRCNAS